jgi:hypothetical protein
MKMLQKVTIQGGTLEEVHKNLDYAVSNGWRRAGGLMYVYEDGYQGWEIEVQKEVPMDEPTVFEDEDSYVGIEAPPAFALWSILGASAMGATIVFILFEVFG